jgi:hypothetical protein
MARAPWPSVLDTDEGWVKSSFSSGSGQCVEIKHARTVVAVRDTKNRAAGPLTFPPTSWHSFVLNM